MRSNLKKKILSSLAKNLWKFLLAVLDQIHLYSYLVFFSIYYSQWTPHWCHTCSFGFKHIIAMVGQKKNSGAVHVHLSRLYLDFILILSWFYLDFILILSWFYLNFIRILSRFFRNSLYPGFIQILSRFYPDLSWFG